MSSKSANDKKAGRVPEAFLVYYFLGGPAGRGVREGPPGNYQKKHVGGTPIYITPSSFLHENFGPQTIGTIFYRALPKEFDAKTKTFEKSLKTQKKK